MLPVLLPTYEKLSAVIGCVNTPGVLLQMPGYLQHIHEKSGYSPELSETCHVSDMSQV
jgi:hypothetical protein